MVFRLCCKNGGEFGESCLCEFAVYLRLQLPWLSRCQNAQVSNLKEKPGDGIFRGSFIQRRIHALRFLEF
jgi:hypothetical protein